MSESAYKSHPIWSLVAQLTEVIENETFYEPTIGENEQYSFARDKIFSTTRVMRAYLEQTPAVLASIHGLNQIYGNFQSVANEITAFIANKNPAHLINAANQIDQGVLPLLWSFSPRLHELDQNIISETVENISKASLLTIKNLKQEETSLTEKISTLSQEIVIQQSKLESLSESIAVQKAEAMAVTAQVQKEYADTEAKRNADFINIIETFKEAFSSHQEESKIKATQLITALETSRDEAANIVQVVGNIGVTGNYQKIANSESKEANLWRWIAVGMFVLGIGTAMATLWKFWDVPFTPENAWSAIIRLLYAIAITTPAWYAAKESARHRSNADSARQTELELASLGPFIELMPTEKKEAIREELIKNYFGKGVTPHEVGDSIQIKDVKDVLVEAIKSFSK
jgi:hypothetical protein